MIIGITGTLGAGKTTVAQHLAAKGFLHLSVRQFLVELLQADNKEINRDNLVAIANDIRNEFGPAYIITELMQKGELAGTDVVIESIRAVGEAEVLKQNDGLIISVNANTQLRYDRALLESSATVPSSFEEFVSQEEREMHSTDPYKQNIAAVILRADYQLLNNESVSDLEQQLDSLLDSLRNRKHV